MIGSASPRKNKSAVVTLTHAGQDFARRGRHVRSAGWRSDLITYNSQFFPFSCKAQNRQQKIASSRGIDPGRAKYQVRHTGATNSLLTGKFSLPVSVNWICGIR